MKRQLLIGGLIVALGVATWFVMAGDSGGARGRTEARGKAEDVAPAPAEPSPAPLVEASSSAAAESAPVLESPGTRQRRASAAEEAYARGVWVEGRVVFPRGTPGDERVFVEARGKKADDDEYHEVEVAPDGTFRVAFGEGTKVGRFVLRARYLFLAEGVRWKAGEPDPIVLEPQLGARIEGRTRLPAGESPGPDDRVQLMRSSANGDSSSSQALDSEGRFEIGGIGTAERYELVFDGERCFAEMKALELRPGETTRVELVLERGVTLSGRVIGEGGAPVVGGMLNAGGDSWASPFDHRMEQVAGDGQFRLKALRPGKIEISVMAPGFTSFQRDLGQLAAGEDQQLTIELSRGGTISGKLLWPDGSPAVGYVFFDGNNFGLQDGQKTAEDGSFTLSGLEVESVTVRARATQTVEVAVKSELTGKERTKKQKTSWNAVVEDVPVGTRDLVLILSASLELVGTVLEQGSGPVDAFRVTAQPLGDERRMLDFSRQVSKSFKDAGGAFTLPGFTSGKWRVTASSKELVDSEPVEVELPTSTPVTLVLRRGATLSGVVVDATGAPVPGATIELEQDDEFENLVTLDDFEGDVRSGADGRFLLSKVTPGVARLKASAPGHAPSATVALEVFSGRETGGIVLTLAPSGTITGEVFDFGGPAAAGTRVWCYDQSGGDFHESAETGAGGRFEIAGAPPGRYHVQADLESGLQLTEQVELAAGGSVHVRLAPSAKNVVALHGRVTLGGEPIAGLDLNAHAQDEGRAGARGETDAQGEYAMKLPGAGTYWISLHMWTPDQRSSRNWNLSLEVPDVRELRQDFALPSARFRGRVTSADGKPLTNVGIQVQERGQEHALALSHATTQTDSSGAYEFVVSPGTLHVQAGGSSGGFEPSEWAGTSREITLAAGQELSGVDFVLARGGRLTGRVRAPDGTLADEVAILDVATGDWIGWTRDDGTFDFGGLAAGTLTLEIQDDQGVTERPVTVTIVADETSTVELDLVAAFHVMVRLPGVPPEAEPRASVSSADGRKRPAWFQDGVLRLPPLTAGIHTLTVELDGKRGVNTFELRGDPGQTELEFDLLLE